MLFSDVIVGLFIYFLSLVFEYFQIEFFQMQENGLLLENTLNMIIKEILLIRK